MKEDLDLSPLKALRSLQFDVWATDWSCHFTAAPKLFSTITSPVFSELVIALARHHLPLPVMLFGVLRRVNEVRRFRLVFLLVVEVRDLYDGRRELAETLDSVTTKGHLDFLNSPPTIRIARPRYFKWDILDFD